MAFGVRAARSFSSLASPEMNTGAIASRIGTLSQRQSLGGTLNLALNSALGRTSLQPIGLNEKYPSPDYPEPQYNPCETNISTLSNGMRVVSRMTNDPICNIGLFVNAGSRYCSSETSGIGHFLESCGVEGTKNINPHRFQENLARTGSGLMIQSFRDAMLYQVETFNKNADFALESIAEIIWNNKISDHRINKMCKEYLWRRGDTMNDPETIIPEYMHQAAYQGNTLGLPLYFNDHTINNVSLSVIDDFLSIFYQPERIICIGVGDISHSSLELMAQNIFGDIKNNDNYNNLSSETAVYTGGQLKFQYNFNNDNNTHISLIFETENWNSPDLMALCVLNMIMGGGGSFSAGGPGKGMYTRLYREVLGTYHWINHISCSHSIFNDSGIFALYGCSSYEQSQELTSIMIRECINMLLRPPNDDEINRAKRALSSNICFEFENRQIVFEDIARQVQVYGTHKTPDMWKNDIMNVNKDDIQRVVKKLLSSNPTLLAMGNDVSKVPHIDEIKQIIKDNT